MTDRPVVFVDFTARHGFNSGVQRVTREVVRVWTAEKRQLTLVGLSDSGVALRRLDASEEARVRDWDQSKAGERSDRVEMNVPLVVPWKTTVFVPENTHEGASATLASIARFSANRTVVLGYDAIPATSGSTVGAVERLRSAAYLAFLKHVDLIVAISASAGVEFSGFTDALVTQGLPGPRVTSVLLPLERIPVDDDSSEESEQRSSSRVVLAVGSNERRKNHLTVLYAAETLWREGLDFSLVIMGGAGSPAYTEVTDAAAALIHRGRPLAVRHDVSETDLARAYLSARFSVFLSVHEGYGLPVAESLAAGTPVLATSFGSTAEIADGGGCQLVDPRDDEKVIATMRVMLQDDALIAELERQIAARDDSSWTDYAHAIWAAVTDPGFADHEGAHA
ncbi:glycosyltransferase [Herbiconiux sp.]|uniref:glycosyltransferase n=1 Tax=Herbiconiux sp. TaxID=1871186 RepID=UPI0025C67B7B|nr:glycosyltransferase [Herbiconiux sp.]